MQRDRPGQNKKKYQSHLLSHFFDTQYSDFKEGLRVYRCTYQDCGYTAGQKNHFLQHVAFKHDKWYKRINRRIEEEAFVIFLLFFFYLFIYLLFVFIFIYLLFCFCDGFQNYAPVWRL